MAVGVDVVFTGLMLICLEGDVDCPLDEAKNTAWVLKVEGERTSCGWYTRRDQHFEMRFRIDDFLPLKTVPDRCTEDPDDTNFLLCDLPDDRICVVPFPDPLPVNQDLDQALTPLPKLEEIDRRFQRLRTERVNDPSYIVASVQFPTGEASAPLWPNSDSPTLWYRSDMSTDRDLLPEVPNDPWLVYRAEPITDGELPRVMSDRLQERYSNATEIAVRSCEGQQFQILLTPQVANAQVTIKNRSDIQDYAQFGQGLFTEFTYLLLYYQLGRWETSDEECPGHAQDLTRAVLLSCKHADFGRQMCACYDGCDAHTTFWPPILRPGQ